MGELTLALAMKKIGLLVRIGIKESLRSSIWHRSLLINVFLWLSLIYLAVNFLLLGYFLDKLLIAIPFEGVDYNTYGESFVLRRLNRLLLYFLFIDLLLRYFMQKLPALTIQPYLHLPISRSSLVHFLLVRSLFSPFNGFHLLIFVPFMVKVFSNLDFAPALGWSVGIVGVIFTMNYFVLFLKRTSEINMKVYASLIAVVVLLVAIEWLGVVDVMGVSEKAFNLLFLYPLSAVVPLVLAGLAYFINVRFLRSNMYLNVIAPSVRSEVSYVGAGILSRFGLIGRLTELEFKFIWRNKRPKSVLLITLLFLAYGLLIFPQEEYAGNYLMYIMFSVIITGMFMMNYGQYLLGWEGSHFDHVLSRNVSFSDYYLSKFLLFAIVSTAAMLLSVPYAYFGLEILLVLFCVFLFNMGVNVHIVMFFGSINPKKIDLSQGTVFNWQGVGASQFLMVIPVLIMPIGIYGLGMLIWNEQIAVILLGAIGLIGLAGTKIWINLLSTWLKKQRHSIAQDFRNQ